MKRLLIASAALFCACHGSARPPSDSLEQQVAELRPRVVSIARERMRRAAETLDPANGYPRSTRADGSWEQIAPTAWTSGFFAGSLWRLYQLTHDDYFRGQAERWTRGLERNASRTDTHDLGFLIFTSFGEGYRLTKDPRDSAVVIAASRSLATRFNPTVGAIKSWDIGAGDPRPKWAFPVIIDNMMNLEMLFWAGTHGGDPAWKTIAERHALTSARALVRPDGSTVHVANFDPATGALLQRTTWQGYSDSSAWARGQAWAIYGFTVAYAETGRPELLQTAERVADWWLAHAPPDGVPYWDFRDPGIPNAPRDASAAAVAACGFLRLARVLGRDGATYRAAAARILVSLSSNYIDPGARMALLAHSTGSKPQGSEVDVGIVYADYYFLEALSEF